MRKATFVLKYGLASVVACLLITCAQVRVQLKEIQNTAWHELVGTWFESSGDTDWIFYENHKFRIEVRNPLEFEQSGEWQTESDTLILMFDAYADQHYADTEYVRFYLYHVAGRELALSTLDRAQENWKRILTR